jgi:hypothetical protein
MRRSLAKARQQVPSDGKQVARPAALPDVNYSLADEWTHRKVARFNNAFQLSVSIYKKQVMATRVADIQAKALEVEKEMQQYITKL